MFKNKFGLYKKLFISTFKISACTFGGGFVIVPLIKKHFVEKLAWVEENEMLDLVAIAQSSPGAIAVNASVLVGYRVAGIIGAVITVLGTILPPLIINSIVSLFYQTFSDNIIVKVALAGMICGVAAVIFDIVISMIKTIFEQKRSLYIWIMVGSFVATYFFSVNIILTILICGVIGAIDTCYQNKRQKEMIQK